MPRRLRHLLLLPVLVALVYALPALPALRNGAPLAVAGGLPETGEFRLATWIRVLHNRCYSVGYSEWRGLPLWAAYRLRPVARTPGQKRPRFETDSRTLRRIAHGDYSRSGYDRGHLAPSHAIGQLCGREAQVETFLMSNIAPQRPALNQKLWQRLEEVELDHFAKGLGEIQVITGPVFGGGEVLDSGLPVPSAFYKIYYQPGLGSRPARHLAFLVPQKVRGTEDLRDYLVSIDAIEAATGLDFLSELPDAEETALEAGAQAAPDWRLNDVARRAPRY
ncbi:MAG: DNA/RNA non-specific endonuclease [Gammaproteobacteria bacterium]|nr:DNA/RNA non-specific endonuclease [Gammaproteobacteria bacterium]